MIQFKKATAQDIELINSLANYIFRDTYKDVISPQQMEYMLDMMYSRQTLLTQLENPNYHYYFIQVDNTPSGYFSIVNLDEEGYLLDKIYVDPTLQGKGVGKQSLQYIKELVAGISPLQQTRIFLHVNRGNHKAINFYTSQGMTIALSQDFEIGGGFYMNDHIMEIYVGDF